MSFFNLVEVLGFACGRQHSIDSSLPSLRHLIGEQVEALGPPLVTSALSRLGYIFLTGAFEPQADVLVPRASIDPLKHLFLSCFVGATQAVFRSLAASCRVDGSTAASWSASGMISDIAVVEN